MAGLAPLQLCHTTELELQRIAGCLYDNIETGRNNYQVAAAIQANTRTDLTEVVSAMPVRPNDPNCSTVDVRVKYRVPDCDTTPKDCADISFTCGVGTASSEKYESCAVTMDECVGDEFTVAAGSYNCDCATTVTQELAIKLANSVRKGYAQYSAKLGEKLAAGVGTTYDGEAFKKLKLFKEDKDGCLQLQPLGLAALGKEYMKQSPNCTDSPIIITGSEKIYDYNYAATNGIFNNTMTQGANAKPLGSNIYYDPALAALLAASPAGVEGAVAFLPGSVSLLEHFKFDNPLFEKTPGGRVIYAPSFVGTKLVRQRVDVGTPILGVPFEVDLQIEYLECEGDAGMVVYKWKKSFDLFKIPQGAFCPDKEFNFCTLWSVVCEPYTCADSCTTTEPVVEPEPVV